MIVHEPECSCETCNPTENFDKLLDEALAEIGYRKGIMVEFDLDELLPKVEE